MPHPGHPEQQRNLHVRRLTGRRLFNCCCVFVAIYEQQPGGVAPVIERRNSAEQNRAVAAIQDREAASPQRTSYSLVHGLDHL